MSFSHTVSSCHICCLSQISNFIGDNFFFSFSVVSKLDSVTVQIVISSPIVYLCNQTEWSVELVSSLLTVFLNDMLDHKLSSLWLIQSTNVTLYTHERKIEELAYKWVPCIQNQKNKKSVCFESCKRKTKCIQFSGPLVNFRIL